VTNPIALQLRAMNILYEGLKEKGSLMVVPSNLVDSMNLGGLIGGAAARQQSSSQDQPARSEANGPTV
jgi:hypothetical protein